ncbi:MAG TPA: hypothetical protein VIH31_01700 [Candidatus Paceibacterota bacterium]
MNTLDNTALITRKQNFGLPVLTCPHCGHEHHYNWDDYKSWIGITVCHKCLKDFFFEIELKPFFSARAICKKHDWGEIKDIDLDENGNPSEDSHGAVWVRECKVCGVFADMEYHLQLTPKNKDLLEVLPQITLNEFFNHPMFLKLKDLFEFFMMRYNCNDHQVREEIATHFYNAIRVIQGEDQDEVYNPDWKNFQAPNNVSGDVVCTDNAGAEGKLTFEKPYYVYQKHARAVQVTDDTGAMNYFHHSRFKKIEEKI